MDGDRLIFYSYKRKEVIQAITDDLKRVELILCNAKHNSDLLEAIVYLEGILETIQKELEENQ